MKNVTFSGQMGLVTMACLWMGCSSSVPGGGTTYVETNVDPRALTAGEQITITCIIRGGSGGAIEGETAWTLEPSEGIRGTYRGSRNDDHQ